MRVSQVRRRFTEQKIDVIASAEPFEVPMDSMLIEQVIINLIENAIYHSGSDEPNRKGGARGRRGGVWWRPGRS